MRTDVDAVCSECNGLTVQLRGRGHDLEYRVCSRQAEPGHLSLDEVTKVVNRARNAACPGARMG